jgi:hypothetical protein
VNYPLAFRPLETLLGFRSQAIFLLAKFRGKRRAKILDSEDLANF